MFNADRDYVPQKVLFLLIPNFSMMAFTSSIEPLRAANRLSERHLYEWRTLSPDGKPIAASNGVTVEPDGGLEDVAGATLAIVCAGIAAERFHDPNVIAWLRRMDRRGVTLGGVCTGPLILARAGLLGGYRCTIHWENVEGFVEEYPDLRITATLFEIDRNRLSCSGGTAPLDMMIHLIATDHGEDLALTVAEQMLHTLVRHPHDPQRMSLRHRTGISDPKVLAAIAQMEAFLETPVSLEELAASASVSPRQLERLFRTHLGKSPRRYYTELRLKRAQLLLAQTAMPILQVAVACGFTSASHFAQCYRELFGRSPRNERSRVVSNGAGAAAETG